MELRSIKELQRERKKLARLLSEPLRADDPLDAEEDAVTYPLMRQRLADIDAELAERTGQAPPPRA